MSARDETEELLPCPFCGSPAEIIDIEDGENAGGSCVSCTRCEASSALDFGRKENFVSKWNTRPSPARDEGAGTMGRGEEFLEFKEALSDLRSLRHEYECLNGGGPGWQARNAEAWKRADELFADEDEAAWQRQQEDAHG